MTLRRPRLIPRLAIKGDSVVVTVNMEGLRKVGKPTDLARQYANQDIDELLYLDVVASLYGRNQLESLIEETCAEVFVPITVGGGIASCEAAKSLLRAGADKVAINTAAIQSPDLITRVADQFGSQALVVSIEAKRVNGGWEAYTENGRQRTGKEAIAWAHEVERLGAGEILLTSIDKDGTMKGPDLELARQIKVGIPVVLAGGIGTPNQATQAARVSDAIAIGAALHYGKTTIREVKEALMGAGKEVR